MRRSARLPIACECVTTRMVCPAECNSRSRFRMMTSFASSRFPVGSSARMSFVWLISAGLAAGEKGEDGTYPAGTVNNLVDEKLRELARRMKEFEAAEDKK